MSNKTGVWSPGADSTTKARLAMAAKCSLCPGLKQVSLLLVPYKYEEGGKASGDGGELSDKQYTHTKRKKDPPPKPSPPHPPPPCLSINCLDGKWGGEFKTIKTKFQTPRDVGGEGRGAETAGRSRYPLSSWDETLRPGVGPKPTHTMHTREPGHSCACAHAHTRTHVHTHTHASASQQHGMPTDTVQGTHVRPQHRRGLLLMFTLRLQNAGSWRWGRSEVAWEPPFSEVLTPMRTRDTLTPTQVQGPNTVSV
jgi:hypothetical protein